jgi:hypothetical protein
MTDTSAIDAFIAGLAAAGTDYLLYSGLPGKLAELRFAGTLAGERILWDARVLAQGRHSTARQFIEIAAAGYPLRRVAIGLNVDEIDAQVLQKTIIMMRNYRRLRAGRHEFGPPGRPAGGP